MMTLSDRVPKNIAANVKQWLEWRAEHPVRGDKGAPVANFVEVCQRPTKTVQLPWYSYRIKNKQEWLYVPFLVAKKAKPLAGAPVEAKCTEVWIRGKCLEHYTNIHRIKHLASLHPLVAEVQSLLYQTNSLFDNVGRCI